jgi:hypothetical protein
VPDPASPAYGSSRARGADVSYAEVERAALAILGAGERPAVASVRARLGRGGPATIAQALKRFWRDLGARAEGDPAALSRLPSEILETVETLWQRALALAAQAARHEDNAARERLQHIQWENSLRAQSLAAREKQLDLSGRARERALADAQEHIRTLMGMLEADRAALKQRDGHMADLEAQLEDYRRQLASLVARAVIRNSNRPPTPRKRRSRRAAKSTRRPSAQGERRRTLAKRTKKHPKR